MSDQREDGFNECDMCGATVPDEMMFSKTVCDHCAEGMDACASCSGLFFPEDMDGEHCNDCASSLFGDDDGSV